MTNLTKKTTAECLTALSINFGLDLQPCYINLVFNQLKDKLNDDDFIKAVNKIINSHETLFNKWPTTATFLKFAGKQELTIEQQAKIEVERILSHAKGYISGKVIFDSPITNAVARAYGIGEIHNQLTNEYLTYRKGEATIRKELVEKWLIYNKEQKEYNSPICIYSSNNFTMIGDKIKCQVMLDKKEIEAKPKEKSRVDLLITNFSNNAKNY